jgi:MoaA/NifB/PqqE/SkfB family radical SAM enzyme
MTNKRTRKEEFGMIEYDVDKDTFTLESIRSLESIKDWQLSAPLTLHWMLTLKCNARCPYCYLLPNLLKPSDKEETLNIDEVRRFIKDFSDLSGFRLYLTGGEPTLNPLLSVIIKIAHENNVKCIVSSNGINIPETVYRAIKENGSRLSLSLDSHIKDIHDSSRKQKSYDSIISTIDRCVKDNIDLRVISVQKDESEQYWADFGRFLADKGVKNWFIQKIIDKKEQTMEESGLEQRLRENFPEMRIRVLPAIYHSFLYVLPNGDVGRDVLTDKEIIYGNVKNESVSSIWQKVDNKAVGDHLGILRYKRKEFPENEC